MVLLIGTLLSCAPEKKNKLEGVWELVSAKYTIPDTTYESTQANWTQIKLITKSHFAFVGEKPNRPHHKGWGTDSERLAAADAFLAGGGTYTLEGDTYTEHVEYFLTPNYVPVSMSFKCQVEGDQWILTGKLPTKSLGIADYDMELYEVWNRIE
jgi:hypothetical protein